MYVISGHRSGVAKPIGLMGMTGSRTFNPDGNGGCDGFATSWAVITTKTRVETKREERGREGTGEAEDNVIERISALSMM